MHGDVMVPVHLCEAFFLNRKIRVLKYLFRLMYANVEGVG